MIVPTAAAALLFIVAIAGALKPYLRPRTIVMERLSDPLDDERRMVLRTLRELELERETGTLSDRDYHTLRSEAEARAVGVLHRIAERDGSDIREHVKEIRSPAPGLGAQQAASSSRKAFVLLSIAVVLAWAVPTLGSALGARTPGQPITGDLAQSSPSPADALTAEEQQVAAHPDDIAARLALARAYSGAANITGAVRQYVAVLNRDPASPEANAQLGLVLSILGRSKSGLAHVERALVTDPTYPEALYIKGYILLRGLGRSRPAVAPLEEYLKVAPFGAERSSVKALLAAARASGAR